MTETNDQTLEQTENAEAKDQSYLGKPDFYDDGPKIYVACLAAYNSGFLHGRWLDASLDVDDLQEAVNAILKASPIEGAEEWAIHDYEGFGGDFVSEYESLSSIADYAEFIAENEEIGGALLSHFSCDLEDAKRGLENYSGEYKSLADYAEQLIEDTTEIPKNLSFYIDYDRMAQDMEMSGDIYSIETAHDEIHVFWSH